VAVQKSGYKQNILFRIAAVLCVFVLITTWLVCGMFARFVSQGAGSDNARVAGFVFDIQDQAGSFAIPVAGIEKPGDISLYTFKLTNKKGEITSEVAQSYKVSLTVNGSMPLTCELISGIASNTEATTEIPVLSVIADGAKKTGTTEGSAFIASSKEDAIYTLKVKWPSSENDAKYASGSAFAEVQLSIQSEQID